MNSSSIENNMKKYFDVMLKSIETTSSISVSGVITKISGMKIEACGIAAALGTLCKIEVSPQHFIYAEVIGFSDKVTYLMANQDITGLRQGSKVIPIQTSHTSKVGMGLLGRILDASGEPIDGLGPLEYETKYPLAAKPINPLSRKRIAQPLDVGIKAINALLTVGKGQRLGIFANSGVGKSVLLGMMTRFTEADIVVVGLIGERSREVKEFIEESLGKEGLAKSVVVASPANTSPLLRANGAILATTIAEYYRDKGYDVLLIVDSLTRYAQAHREIALAAGELPSTKGFTPSVFAKIAHLLERSGNGSEDQGSITAFYTVLVEGEANYDPVADHAKSVLDGHIFLSKKLADQGHYPAIDVEKSISRVMTSIVDQEHYHYLLEFKKFYSSYQKNRDLLNVGMYQPGADKILDQAIKYKDNFELFLKQGVNESTTMEDSLNKLKAIFN